jgi:hypothetical protein
VAEVPREPRDGRPAGVEPGRGSPPGMPRWVKVIAIIIGILVVLFVVLQLTGIGGRHGPGRHMSAGDPATTRSVAELQAWLWDGLA